MKKATSIDYATALATFHFRHGFTEGLLHALKLLRASGSASEAISYIATATEEAIERAKTAQVEMESHNYNEFLRFLREAEEKDQA